MGSSHSGLYSGTRGGSQPYAEKYPVIPSALAQDKKDPDIYNREFGYFKNPTATDLTEAIRDSRIYIDGKRQDGIVTYVMDSNGNIILGIRCNPNDGRKRSPHPTLIGGKNPKVQCAGMMTFRKGKISSVDTNSGHYRPNIQSLSKVNKALQKICDRDPSLFTSDSIWRNEQ